LPEGEPRRDAGCFAERCFKAYRIAMMEVFEVPVFPCSEQ